MKPAARGGADAGGFRPWRRRDRSRRCGHPLRGQRRYRHALPRPLRASTPQARAAALLSASSAPRRATCPFRWPLERHPLGSQAFVPLGGRATWWWWRRTRRRRGPFSRSARASTTAAACGHHPLIVLDRITDFLCIDRAGTGENCDEVSLAQEWVPDLTLAAAPVSARRRRSRQPRHGKRGYLAPVPARDRVALGCGHLRDFRRHDLQLHHRLWISSRASMSAALSNCAPGRTGP